jgi:hypothetical protein
VLLCLTCAPELLMMLLCYRSVSFKGNCALLLVCFCGCAVSRSPLLRLQRASCPQLVSAPAADMRTHHKAISLGRSESSGAERHSRERLNGGSSSSSTSSPEVQLRGCIDATGHALRRTKDSRTAAAGGIRCGRHNDPTHHRCHSRRVHRAACTVDLARGILK